MFIILAIIVVLVLWFVFMYNNFVRKVNRSKEAWADIDVQLKRRYDLIPNLINTVKGYAAHESSTFEKITQARSAAMSATGPAQKAQAEQSVMAGIRGIYAVAEQYPELKANANFMQLQSDLTDTENKIQAARRFYNSNVRDLNTAIEVFPNNMIANTFHFSKMELFELPEGDVARENVKVQF